MNVFVAEHVPLLVHTPKLSAVDATADQTLATNPTNHMIPNNNNINNYSNKNSQFISRTTPPSSPTHKKQSSSLIPSSTCSSPSTEKSNCAPPSVIGVQIQQQTTINAAIPTNNGINLSPLQSMRSRLIKETIKRNKLSDYQNNLLSVEIRAPGNTVVHSNNTKNSSKKKKTSQL